MTDGADARVVLPPHRARPLVAAARWPTERRSLAHGLAVEFYPPAAGRCAGCGERANRISAAGRLCPSCIGRGPEVVE
jgi:hypothetical protein